MTQLLIDVKINSQNKQTFLAEIVLSKLINSDGLHVELQLDWLIIGHYALTTIIG